MTGMCWVPSLSYHVLPSPQAHLPSELGLVPTALLEGGSCKGAEELVGTPGEAGGRLRWEYQALGVREITSNESL